MPNRVMISPMCQYSAEGGLPTAWHHAHLGGLAMSGAGLLCLEATAVSAEGRITPGCLGLWSDAHEVALKALVGRLRSFATMPLALQLSHAGRKASSRSPWQGGSLIDPEDPTSGGWTPLGPSAVAHKPSEKAPLAMTSAQVKHVVADFARAAARARAIGFEAIELHMAHGYLMHQFMSPLSNQRDDAYGGTLENRLRLPLEAFDAVREAAGPGVAVGVRLSATDWAEPQGWDLAQSIVLSKQLQARGCDFLDISSGGVWSGQKIPLGPGYQVHLAEAIKREVDIPVVTVGLITQARQAEDIVSQGRADVVAMARGFLFDPRWPWRAAAELGGTVAVPPQLIRALPAGHAPVFGDVRIGQR